jgi:enoyl-CoA hydratase/carnithine racemase
MVSQVVPDERFEEEVTAVVRTLAAGPPLAFRRMKENFRAGERSSFEELVELEVDHMLALIGTADFKEGLEAFGARRAPHFAGR